LGDDILKIKGIQTISIFRLQDKIINMHNLSPTTIESYCNQGTKELIYLNQNIEPGDTEYITLGLVFDCYENGTKKKTINDIDTIFMTFQLLFNNGQEHVFRRALLIPEFDS